MTGDGNLRVVTTIGRHAGRGQGAMLLLSRDLRPGRHRSRGRSRRSSDPVVIMEVTIMLVVEA
jgi:hypothetical protein